MIRTERLLLREWRDEDLPAFADINNDPDVMTYLPQRLSVEESDLLAERLRAEFAGNGFGRWAVEIPGVVPFAGFVGLSAPTFDAPFMPCVEVGWRLARSCWNQGYATEAAQAAVTHGFETLGLKEIVSFTVPHNTASRRVMEKLGMVEDVAGQFDHPLLPDGHSLRRHVLYRLPAPQ